MYVLSVHLPLGELFLTHGVYYIFGTLLCDVLFIHSIYTYTQSKKAGGKVHCVEKYFC